MKKLSKVISLLLLASSIAAIFSACGNIEMSTEPGHHLSVELTKTNFGMDDPIYVNISVGLYHSVYSAEYYKGLEEGKFILLVHDYKTVYDYSNYRDAEILAVLDSPPEEPFDKYLFKKVDGEIEYNYNEDYVLPSNYFSESEGKIAISLIRTDSELDDLSNLYAAFSMTSIVQYTIDEDGITLSHYKP